MSAAAQPLEDPDQFGEGWRAGRIAARFAVHAVQGDATKPGARDALAVALQRIDALSAPPASVAMPRADRLADAIRAALALSEADLGPEAAHTLRDALR